MAEDAFQRILLKLSGEALLGKEDYGIDPDIIHRIAVEISDVTVAKLLQQKSASVNGFDRLAVGEGIEKKEENFAEEVMQQVSGG